MRLHPIMEYKVYDQDMRLLKGAILGGLRIAEQAMPDTYLVTDSRVRKMRKALDRIKEIYLDG